MKTLVLSPTQVDALVDTATLAASAALKQRTNADVEDRERANRRLDDAVDLKQRLGDATALRGPDEGAVLIVGTPPVSLIGTRHVRRALEDVFGEEAPLPAAIEQALQTHEALLTFANAGLQVMTQTSGKLLKAARHLAEALPAEHNYRPQVDALVEAISAAERLPGIER